MFETLEQQEAAEKIKNRRVAVLGAARSGIAVAKLLAENGASVLLSDNKPAISLNLPAEDLNKLGIKIETGGHSDKVLESDYICISPGLPLTIPVLQNARKKGIPILGEIEIASWFNLGKMIAITGSNGKTTTTTLTGNILSNFNNETIVAGNIGQPYAGQVRNSSAGGFTLLEISSFQLETIASFKPDIAVIMNLTPNHLDRYPSFVAYADAKMNILKNMGPQNILIYNRDDEYLSERIAESNLRKIPFSISEFEGEGAYWKNETIFINLAGKKTKIEIPDYQLLGPHNRYNMVVASLISTLCAVPAELISAEIAKFGGIEHRLEFVRELNGRKFINDSKATTVDSLSYALKSFKEKIVLIAGGKDKGGDFSQLRPLLEKNVRHAVLIGQATGRISKEWQGSAELSAAPDVAAAVKSAFSKSLPGDIILLSPACSSFDMFTDYENRGETFKKLVKEL